MSCRDKDTESTDRTIDNNTRASRMCYECGTAYMIASLRDYSTVRSFFQEEQTFKTGHDTFKPIQRTESKYCISGTYFAPSFIVFSFSRFDHNIVPCEKKISLDSIELRQPGFTINSASTEADVTAASSCSTDAIIFNNDAMNVKIYIPSEKSYREEKATNTPTTHSLSLLTVEALFWNIE